MTATTAAFKAAAQKTQPYVFDFDREVEDFYRAWPERQEDIFFIDASNSSSGSLVYGEGQDADKISEFLNDATNLSSIVAEKYKSGINGAVNYPVANIDVVILKTPKNQHHFNLLGHDAPSGMVDVFSFDHEIGHVLVAPENRNEFNLNEHYADAYAVIRHLQRFGNDDSVIKNLTAMRAAELTLQGDGSHFTSPMVEKIIADSKDTDFTALSLQETVERAKQYADENAPSRIIIKGMAGNLGAFASRLLPETMRGDYGSLKKLGEFALSTIMPDEFKWGKAAVLAFLDGQVSFDGIRIRPPVGEEWMQLRRKLEAHEAAMSEPTQPKLIVISNNQL